MGLGHCVQAGNSLFTASYFYSFQISHLSEEIFGPFSCLAEISLLGNDCANSLRGVKTGVFYL